MQQQGVIVENTPWLQILHINLTRPVNASLRCGRESCRLLAWSCLCSQTGTDPKHIFFFSQLSSSVRLQISPHQKLQCWSFSRFESMAFKIPGMFSYFSVRKKKKKELYNYIGVYIYLCMYLHSYITAEKGKSCYLNDINKNKHKNKKGSMQSSEHTS